MSDGSVLRLRVFASILVLLAVMLGASNASAHPLNPALLDLRESPGGAVDVRWRMPAGGAVSTPLRPVLPSQCADVGTKSESLIQGGQSVSSRWQAHCGTAGLAGAQIRVDGLDERRTEALLRVQLADGRVLQSVLRPGQSEFVVPSRNGVFEVLRSYGKMGFLHILSGPDHLAFVFGLLLLVRERRRLFWTITAFTAGHTVTLSLAALGVVQLPPGPVEVLIAASIFVLGVELARAPEDRRLGARPWWMAGVFGLLHGLGFAGALAEIGLPKGEIPAALLSFNVGIEIGQILFVAVVLGAFALWRRLPVRTPAFLVERLRHAPAYAIGALSTVWIFERL